MRTPLILAFIFILAVSFTGCSSSQKMAQHGAETETSYQDVPVPDIEWEPLEYREFKLDNGIDGIVMTDAEVPLADFFIAFPAPPDPEGKVGLAEMTTYTLRNGGGVNLPADSLNELLEFKGARLSVWAGQEQLYVYGTGLKEDLDMILKSARELIDNPAYPEQKIEFKRSNMLEEIRRSNDEPRSIAYREIYELLYPDHPWGRENTITTVNAITRGDLIEYHDKVFQPSGCVIGVSGDVSLAEANRLANEYFGDLKGSGLEIESLPAVGEAAKPAIYYAQKDVNQAYVMLGHQTIDYSNPHRHAAKIMNYILGGGGFQSILLKRIRVDEGLAYSVGSVLSTPVSVKGSFRVGASTRLSEAGRTMQLIDEIITEFKENGPTQEQFEQAKKAYLNSHVWEFENTDDFLRNLVYYKWRGLPLDTPQRDIEAYQALTVEDVKAAANELLKPDQLIKVVIGDKDKMDKPLENFGEVKDLDISIE